MGGVSALRFRPARTAEVAPASTGARRRRPHWSRGGRCKPKGTSAAKGRAAGGRCWRSGGERTPPPPSPAIRQGMSVHSQGQVGSTGPDLGYRARIPGRELRVCQGPAARRRPSCSCPVLERFSWLSSVTESDRGAEVSVVTVTMFITTTIIIIVITAFLCQRMHKVQPRAREMFKRALSFDCEALLRPIVLNESPVTWTPDSVASPVPPLNAVINPENQSISWLLIAQLLRSNPILRF